jgi:hypothetical protein
MKYNAIKMPSYYRAAIVLGLVLAMALIYLGVPLRIFQNTAAMSIQALEICSTSSQAVAIANDVM